MSNTPTGITPPTPGLEHEEPELWIEDDIPSGGEDPAARSERPSNKPERE